MEIGGVVGRCDNKEFLLAECQGVFALPRELLILLEQCAPGRTKLFFFNGNALQTHTVFTLAHKAPLVSGEAAGGQHGHVWWRCTCLVQPPPFTPTRSSFALQSTRA